MAITDPFGYGIDVSCGPSGLDPTFQLIAGQTTLLQQAFRRLTTARQLLTFHPGDGKDVRAFLNDGFTPARLFQIQSDVAQELLKDERFDRVACAATFNARSAALRLTVFITPKAPGTPFKLVLLVTALTVELLEGG